jgi:hypothetical protein
MAKIIDPDDLIVSSSEGNLGVDGNIWLDTTNKTFELAPYGSLVAKDGVTGNAIWAKFVDLWTSSSYQPFPFPMNILDARSGQYIFGQDPGGSYNGWKPEGDVTRQMIRDAGWSEYSSGGVLNRQYVGLVALASGFPAGAQFYYQKASSGVAADFTFTDAPNEAIQVFGDSGNGDFDNRTFFKLFCREEAYLYDDAILGDVGETGTGAYKVALPIAVGADLDITDNDTDVAANTPYTDIKIRYFDGAYSKDVDTDGAPRSFGIVVDVGTHSGIDGSAPGSGSVLTTSDGGMTIDAFIGGTLTIHEGTDAGASFPITDNDATTITVTGTISSGSNLSFTAQKASPTVATLKQIYTKIQYQLRQDANINAASGTVNGKTASMLLNFVGSSLKCGFYAPTNGQGGGSGVMIEGIRAADINSIVFYDNGAVAREYPYASAGNLNFNAALTSGGTGYYRMYFTTTPDGDDYGEAAAVTVNDADGNPITGTISAGQIAFTFDYTGNTQGGRVLSPLTDCNVTVVAGNAGSAKPVVATGVISQSKSISITLTAETDRAYLP